jgi:hypothetical protein
MNKLKKQDMFSQIKQIVTRTYLFFSLGAYQSHGKAL